MCRHLLAGLLLGLLGAAATAPDAMADEVAAAREEVRAALELARAGRETDALARLAASVPVLEARSAPAAEVLEALDLWTVLLLQTSRPQEALPLAGRALALARRTHSGDHEALSQALNRIVSVHLRLGQPALALPLQVEELAMSRRLHPEGAPEVAGGLNDLAVIYGMLGRHGDALPLKLEVLAMERRAVPRDDAGLSRALNNLAYTYGELGRDAEAAAAWEEALALRRGQPSSSAADLVQVLFNLATGYRRMGRLAEALALNEEAVERARRAFGPAHPHLALALGHCAATLTELERHEPARALKEEALELLRRLHPQGHPELASALSNLASTWTELGQPAEALPFNEEALALRRRLLAQDHPHLALSLGNLARTYAELGREEDARACYDEALQMNRRLFPGDHPAVAASLGNLGALHAISGRPAEARPLLEQSLAMYRALHPGDHRSVASAQARLATVLARLGEIAPALELEEATVAMLRRLDPEGSSSLARALGNRALTLESLGRGEEALSAMREAAALGERLGWARRGTLLQNLGRGLLARGEAREARAWLLRAVELRENGRAQARGLSFLERLRFAEASPQGDAHADLARACLAAGQPDEALTALERGRGREMLDLLEAGRDDPVERALEGARSAGDEDEAAALTQARARLESAEVVAVQAAAAEDRAVRTFDWDLRRRAAESAASARRALEQARADVARRVRGVLPGLSPLPAADLRRLLGPGERLLAFQIDDAACHLLVAGAPGVSAHPLTDGDRPLTREVLAGALTALLSRLGDPAEPPVADVAERVFTLLFPPAAWSEVRTATRVYVLAHRELHALPLEALVVGREGPGPAAQARWWLDDGPPVAYEASASVLAWLRARRDAQMADRTPLSLVALGDPVFAPPSAPWPPEGALITGVGAAGAGARAGLRLGDVIVRYGDRDVASGEQLAHALAQTPTASELVVGLWRGGRDLSLRLPAGPLGIALATEAPGIAGPRLLAAPGGDAPVRARLGRRARLEPLPGTRLEVERLGRLYRAAGAEEGRVRLLLGAEAAEEQLLETVREPRVLHLATHGLAEARAEGAFLALALSPPLVPTRVDDGFLTLEDLLGRWRGRLARTELVVLSACDTQRGATLVEEMTLALPWGLHFAGCPTVVATQWSVDDASAPELMEDVHRRLLAEGSPGPLGALVAAKRALRARFPHPRHWAPFVLLGVPR